MALFVLFAPSVYLNSNRRFASPEDEARHMLVQYLKGRGELNRLDYAECRRIGSDEHEKSQGIYFYINCLINKPLADDNIYFSVAFGQRGYVEFSDVDRRAK